MSANCKNRIPDGMVTGFIAGDSRGVTIAAMKRDPQWRNIGIDRWSYAAGRSCADGTFRFGDAGGKKINRRNNNGTFQRLRKSDKKA